MNQDQDQQATYEEQIHIISDDVVDAEEQKSSHMGYKAPVPWDGWTEEQRREAFNGFLYPSWHPFAVLEGNYVKSPYFDTSHLKAPAKVQGEVDEALEIRKKQFAVPMVNKASYTANVPAKALKRK